MSSTLKKILVAGIATLALAHNGENHGAAGDNPVQPKADEGKIVVGDSDWMRQMGQIGNHASMVKHHLDDSLSEYDSTCSDDESGDSGSHKKRHRDEKRKYNSDSDCEDNSEDENNIKNHSHRPRHNNEAKCDEWDKYKGRDEDEKEWHRRWHEESSRDKKQMHRRKEDEECDDEEYKKRNFCEEDVKRHLKRLRHKKRFIHRQQRLLEKCMPKESDSNEHRRYGEHLNKEAKTCRRQYRMIKNIHREMKKRHFGGEDSPSPQKKDEFKPEWCDVNYHGDDDEEKKWSNKMDSDLRGDNRNKMDHQDDKDCNDEENNKQGYKHEDAQKQLERMIRKQRFIEKKQRVLEQCKQEQDRELIRRQVDYLVKQAEMLRRQQKMVENRKQKEDEAWMREQEKIASGGHIKKEEGEKDKKGDNKAWTWGWN